MKGKNQEQEGGFSLRKCLTTFYTQELFFSAKYVQRNRGVSYFLLCMRSALMAGVCFVEDNFDELVRYDTKMLFLNGDWANSLRNSNNQYIVIAFLVFNYIFLMTLTCLIIFWISSSRKELKNKQKVAKCRIHYQSGTIETVCRQLFSILVNVYLYVVQIPSLWISLRQSSSIYSICNIVFTVFLGFVSADVDYNYIILTKDSLSRPLSALQYLNVLWDLLILIIKRLLTGNSMKLLLVFYIGELAYSLYRPFYSKSVQQLKIFQNVYFLVVIATPLIMEIFSIQYSNVFSVFLCVGIPLCWKISMLYIESRETKLEMKLLNVLDKEPVGILDLNYLMRVGILRGNRSTEEAQKRVDFKLSKQMSINCIGKDKNQEEYEGNNDNNNNNQDSNKDDTSSIMKKNTISMNQFSSLYTDKMISSTSRYFNAKEHQPQQTTVLSNSYFAYSNTFKTFNDLPYGKRDNYSDQQQLLDFETDQEKQLKQEKSMKQSLNEVFKNYITSKKLNLMKGRDIAVYFIYLIQGVSQIKLYWICRRIANSFKQNSLKDAQVLETIENIAYKQQYQELLITNNTKNPFSDIHSDVLLFEKIIKKSWILTEQAISFKVDILNIMKQRMIKLTLLIEKIEQFQKMRDKLKKNLNMLATVNNHSHLLQELQYVYLETLAFNDKDLIIQGKEEESLYRHKRLTPSMAEIILLEKDSCVIAAKYEEGGGLEIKQVSDSLSKVFSLFKKKEEAIGKKVDTLMPRSFQNIHKKYVQRYLSTEDSAEQGYQSQLGNLFAAVSGIFIRPISLDIRINEFDLKGQFGFCGKINLQSVKRQYVLYERNSGRVVGITQETAENFFDNLENFHSVNIFSLIPILKMQDSLMQKIQYNKTENRLSMKKTKTFSGKPQIQRSEEQIHSGIPTNFLFVKKRKGLTKSQGNYNNSDKTQEMAKQPLIQDQFQFFMLTLQLNGLQHDFLIKPVNCLEILLVRELHLETNPGLIVSNLSYQLTYLRTIMNVSNFHISIPILERLLKEIQSPSNLKSTNKSPFFNFNVNTNNNSLVSGLGPQVTSSPHMIHQDSSLIQSQDKRQYDLKSDRRYNQMEQHIHSYEGLKAGLYEISSERGPIYTDLDEEDASNRYNLMSDRNLIQQAKIAAQQNLPALSTTKRIFFEKSADRMHGDGQEGSGRAKSIDGQREVINSMEQQYSNVQHGDIINSKSTNILFSSRQPENFLSSEEVELQKKNMTTLRQEDKTPYLFVSENNSHKDSIPEHIVQISMDQKSAESEVSSESQHKDQQNNNNINLNPDIPFEQVKNNNIIPPDVFPNQDRFQKQQSQAWKGEDVFQDDISKKPNERSSAGIESQQIREGLNREIDALKRITKKQNDIESTSSSKESSTKAARQLLNRTIFNKSSPLFIKFLNIVGVLSYSTLILTISIEYSSLSTSIYNNKEDNYYSSWPIDFQAGVNAIVRDRNLKFIMGYSDFDFGTADEKATFLNKVKGNILQMKDQVKILMAQTSGINSHRLVFELLQSTSDTYNFGQYYNHSQLAGDSSVPDDKFYTAQYPTTLHYSILLSCYPTMRYALGISTGRSEYYIILQNLNFHTALIALQASLMEASKVSDINLENELTLVMVVVIVVSAACLVVIFPLYAYVQSTVQGTVSLFATFQAQKIESLLSKIAIGRDYMKLVFPHSLGMTKSNRDGNQVIDSRKNTKNISYTTNLPKVSMQLVFQLIVIYAITIVYPILNKQLTQIYLENENNTLETIIHMYQIKGYIVESIALHYNNLFLKLHPNDKPLSLSTYIPKTQSLIEQSGEYQLTLLEVVQEETSFTRYSQDLYSSFFYEILHSDICKVIQKYPEYISNSTVLNFYDCVTIRDGFLRKGFQIALKEFLQVFPIFQSLYLITDPTQYSLAISALTSTLDLKDFTKYEEFLEYTLITLRDFAQTISQRYYDYITQIQFGLFLMQVLLMTLIFLFGWVGLSSMLRNQLFKSKWYLSSIDIETLLENSYVLSYIKKYRTY